MKFLFLSYFLVVAVFLFVSADEYHHQQNPHYPAGHVEANGIPTDHHSVQQATASHLAHHDGHYPHHYNHAYMMPYLNHFQQELAGEGNHHQQHHYQGGHYVVKPEHYPTYPHGHPGHHYMAKRGVFAYNTPAHFYTPTTYTHGHHGGFY